MHASKRNIEIALLLGLSLFFAPPSWGATANLVAGWNLLGNSSSASLDVASTFGNSTQVTTVWKWVSATSRWAFYAPSLNASGTLASYAAGKGYDVLSAIGAGEGFWVNAQTTFTAQLPAGTSVTSASFRTTLAAGWNLIASGDNQTPSEFNQALSVAPPAFGTIPTNLITLWSWDAAQSNWYFYAPSLEANATLGTYVASKNYLDYGATTLGQTTGFWVNRAAPPAAIALDSADAMSVQPMSILTLSGTGFDTTALTKVRFSDGNQYAVDVLPIRITSTTLSVAVPPYFNATSAVFAAGTVSVKVTQTSGAGTRTSGTLAGLQILDLPTPAGAPGTVTLNFLQSLQANTSTLQISVSGTALSALLGSALTDQANALNLLINTLQPVVSNVTGSASLGTVNGVNFSFGASGLLQTDRLLLGAFQALSNGTTATIARAAGTSALARLETTRAAPGRDRSSRSASTRAQAPLQLAYGGALGNLGIGALIRTMRDPDALGVIRVVDRALLQLAQSGGASASQIPMQAEAEAYTQCLLGPSPDTCSGGSMLRAPQETLPGRLPDATNTALTVVGASLIGAVAIAALVGTPVAATTGVLALAGYLAYATLFTGVAQIGIGATLGQTSDDAKKLVQGGLKQLDDFVRDTTISLGMGTIAGETAGLVNDVVTSGKNLREALLPTTSAATTTTAANTTTTAATTTTTTATTTTTNTTVSSTTTTTAASGLGISGNWSGNWSVSSPAACAIYSGTWSAVFVESANGTLSGTWESSDGSGGSVSGARSGSSASWSVGGSGGASFSGSISGNGISGGFSSPDDCYDPDTFAKLGKMSGGYSGSKQ